MTKFLIGATFLFSTLLVGPAHASPAPDKQAHFLVSGTIASAAYLSARSVGHGKKFSYVAGIGLALAVGFTKEAFDHFAGLPGSRFDWNDMGANALGAITVPLLVVAW